MTDPTVPQADIAAVEAPHPGPAGIPAATPIALGSVGRLTKIEIDDYRAFRGHFELELADGQNLLLYGENGAGKSSLFRALTDFLESPDTLVLDARTKAYRTLRPEDNRHRFSTQPASVRLTFTRAPQGATGAAAKTYEWSTSKSDPATADMRTVDRGKGCLDYRSLLKIHLVPTGRREIDLFDIFLKPILAHCRNPASAPSLPFLEEWNRIKTPFYPYNRKPARLDDWINQFNAGFERVVKDTVAKASEFLTGFDAELAIEVEFTPASYRWPGKILSPPKIIAKPVFRRLEQADYYHVLNEARLSALAVALYLAGLHVSAAGEARLLVLDDILIGLDMANRVKVLDLVHREFANWQIFIFTYSKSWFERLKQRVKPLPWVAPWKAVVFREEWAGGEASPRVVADDCGDPFETARRHLARKDFTAAAIYVRTALETVCHTECAKSHLRILCVENQKHRKLDHYIQAIEGRLGQLADGATRDNAIRLISQVREATAFVLNREAHFDIEDEDTLSAEVGEAIKTVSDLATFLADTLPRKQEFFGEMMLRPSDLAAIDLAEASKLAAHGMHVDSLKKLASAHKSAWEALGARRGVSLPMGAQPSAAVVWSAARDQDKLDAVLDERLKAARPYLFGSLDAADFSPAGFAAAVSLVDELLVAAAEAHAGSS